MTEILEPGFGLDLPGRWEQVESAEPGAFAYRETEGDGAFTVTMLAVRSVYALSDSKRLLDDYCSHRLKYEQGQVPTLEQSEPVSSKQSDTVEGGWDGVDVATGRRVRHKVVLVRNTLADFRYEAPGSDEVGFAEGAEVVLGGATVSPE